MNARVGIVIPTLNRPDFVIRQLAYYAAAGSGIALYAADSTEGEGFERVEHAVDSLQGSLSAVHLSLPGLNETEAIHRALDHVAEPYAVFVWDDDFLIPSGLIRSAEFLDSRPDYSSAHGVAVIASMASRSGGDEHLEYIRPYRQRCVEEVGVAERLCRFLEDYFVTLFSVHRTEDFREIMRRGNDVKATGMRELLESTLSIVMGKAGFVDTLFLVRVDHAGRYLLPDVFDRVTSADWPSAYDAFRRHMSDVLRERHGIGAAEADELVKKAYWRHLAKNLSRRWHLRYATGGGPLVRKLRILWNGVSTLPEAADVLRGYMPSRKRLSLPTLLGPSSPYHADFMPVYRSLSGVGCDPVPPASSARQSAAATGPNTGP